MLIHVHIIRCIESKFPFVTVRTTYECVAARLMLHLILKKTMFSLIPFFRKFPGIIIQNFSVITDFESFPTHTEMHKEDSAHQSRNEDMFFKLE
jgi:hypothetical protein